MDGIEGFISELVGRTILIKTHWGLGTKDISLMAGEYKGLLLGFDGTFLKLEYEIKKFTSGKNEITKGTILINSSYILTINEYVNKDE